MSGQALTVLTADELRALVRDAVREALGNQRPAPKKAYWTAAEIADHFDVCRATVTNWVREGCPHHLRGNVLRFELPAVDAWFQAKK